MSPGARVRVRACARHHPTPSLRRPDLVLLRLRVPFCSNVFRMATLHLVSVLPLGLALVSIAALGTLAILRARRRRRSARRVVEKPNSHYTARLARESVDRHRWRGMTLEGVHEINREEVLRLLAKVEATSVQALTAKERAFLDRIAELSGRRRP